MAREIDDIRHALYLAKRGIRDSERWDEFPTDGPSYDDTIEEACRVADKRIAELERQMRETALSIDAAVREDLTVWVSISHAGVKTDLGVYGPYPTKAHADVAAREAIANVTRQVQAQKDRLLAQLIDV